MRPNKTHSCCSEFRVLVILAVQMLICVCYIL
jgi:hypothetical protein